MTRSETDGRGSVVDDRVGCGLTSTKLALREDRVPGRYDRSREDTRQIAFRSWRPGFNAGPQQRVASQHGGQLILKRLNSSRSREKLVQLFPKDRGLFSGNFRASKIYSPSLQIFTPWRVRLLRVDRPRRTRNVSEPQRLAIPLNITIGKNLLECRTFLRNSRATTDWTDFYRTVRSEMRLAPCLTRYLASTILSTTCRC